MGGRVEWILETRIFWNYIWVHFLALPLSYVSLDSLFNTEYMFTTTILCLLLLSPTESNDFNIIITSSLQQNINLKDKVRKA